MLCKIIMRSKHGRTILGCEVFLLGLSRIFPYAAMSLRVIPLTQLLLLFIVFSPTDMRIYGLYSFHRSWPSWMIIRQSTSSKVFRRCSNCFPHAAHYPTKNPTADGCSRAHILRVFPPCPQVWIPELSKSLKTGLSHLSDPETPTLVRLSTGIIEGIWICSIQNLVAMKATLDALPSVLRTLGIATVSFLKVRSGILRTARALSNIQSIIPQLVHIMACKNNQKSSVISLNCRRVPVELCSWLWTSHPAVWKDGSLWYWTAWLDAGLGLLILILME